MVDFFRRAPRSTKVKSGVKQASNLDSGRDAALDIDFYRSFYPDLAAYDDDEVSDHWKRHGRSEKRAPNAQAAILGHAAYDILPKDFNPYAYVALNQDLDKFFHNAVVATRHYLDFGLKEGRLFKRGYEDPRFKAAFLRRFPKANGVPDPRLVWAPGNIAQYLLLSGFDDDGFMASFDDAFYAEVNSVTADPDGRRFACIFHFVEQGADQLLPVAEDLLFDAAFHRRQLAKMAIELASLDNASLYRRWLSLNDFKTHPPNHRVLMKQRFGVACESGGVIDIETYRFANADLRQADNDVLLEHLFSDGLFEQRSSVKITPANVGLFTSYADRLLQSDKGKAEALYGRLCHIVSDYPLLNQHHGDLLLRDGKYTAAYLYFARNLELGTAGQWTFRNASYCCDRLGDLRGALRMLDAGCRAFPEEQKMRCDRDAMADRYFADELGYARSQAMAGRINEAQDRLYAAAELCTVLVVSTAPTRPVRTVALFANMDLPQCVLYRIEQKFEQLNAAGYIVEVFNWSLDSDAFHRNLVNYDAVIFYRVAAFPSVIRSINAARAAGLTTFYEIDDLVFDSAEFPEPFADYAGQLSWTEYVDVAVGVPLFRYAMELCDYAIASTPALAERMKPLVRKQRAFLHRNALGRRHEDVMASGRQREAEGGPVTIFYGSGTKAHKLDFERILLPALEEVDRRFGDKVRFLVAGHKPIDAKSDLLERIRFEPFTPDVEAYWALVRQADICLSVLRSSAATDVKSEIKWMEAAMFAVPSVVSATRTFSEVIEDGVDGFLVTDTKGFIDAISKLVTDPQKRAGVARRARAKVEGSYSVEALASNLRDIFLSTTETRSERTRVLVVNVYYAPQAKGGATRVVIDNIRDIRDLAPDEFEFEVFTTIDGGVEPYTVQVSSHDGVRVTAMTAGNYPGSDLAALDEQAAELFRRCVERFAPQIIHFHCIQHISASVTEIALKLGIPYIITAHDGWWICDHQFLFDGKGVARCYDFDTPLRNRAGSHSGRYDRPSKLLPSIRGAAAIVAVSESFADIYRASGIKNVKAIPNGLPRISRTPTLSKGRDASPSQEKICIGHIGGLEPHKGFPLLRRALLVAKPQNLMVLAVDLSLEPGEERIESWNGTSVRIVARRHQTAMPALYDKIDVLFAPSLWPESFGLVTREALAAGCWVVASDRGAVGEPVVEGVNGHIVSVNDLSGLVTVLSCIDRDPEHYRTKPPRIQQRSGQDQAAELATLYRDLIRSVCSNDDDAKSAFVEDSNEAPSLYSVS